MILRAGDQIRIRLFKMSTVSSCLQPVVHYVDYLIKGMAYRLLIFLVPKILHLPFSSERNGHFLRKARETHVFSERIGSGYLL